MAGAQVPNPVTAFLRRRSSRSMTNPIIEARSPSSSHPSDSPPCRSSPATREGLGEALAFPVDVLSSASAVEKRHCAVGFHANLRRIGPDVKTAPPCPWTSLLAFDGRTAPSRLQLERCVGISRTGSSATNHYTGLRHRPVGRRTVIGWLGTFSASKAPAAGDLFVPASRMAHRPAHQARRGAW